MSFKFSLALTTVMLCSLVATGCSRPSDEDKVKKAFFAYMNAWKKGDIGSVWEIMSPRLKRGNDNSIKKFEGFTKEQGFFPSGYKIDKVIVGDKTARVRATIMFSDSHRRRIGEEQEECQFVLDGSRWYFDDCKPNGADKSSYVGDVGAIST